MTWVEESKDEPYVGLVNPNGCVKFIQEVGYNE